MNTVIFLYSMGVLIFWLIIMCCHTNMAQPMGLTRSVIISMWRKLSLQHPAACPCESCNRMWTWISLQQLCMTKMGSMLLYGAIKSGLWTGQVSWQTCIACVILNLIILRLDEFHQDGNIWMWAKGQGVHNMQVRQVWEYTKWCPISWMWRSAVSRSVWQADG
jgi:hypothetical protein